MNVMSSTQFARCGRTSLTVAPHVPWRSPEEDIAPYRELGLEEDMAKFYGMITNLDDNMGRLRSVMREEGIEDNTIFIFMTVCPISQPSGPYLTR